MANPRIPEPGEPIYLATFFLEDRRFPAVYFLYHHGEVVYVGQSRTLAMRIDQHLTEGVKTFDAVGFIRCHLDELIPYESHHIRKLAPKYNGCSISKKVRERDSWARDEARVQARRPDAFRYHIEAAAEASLSGEDGEYYIRPKDLGKFLMVSDKDAAELTGSVSENIPLVQMFYWIASNHREVAKAQQRFEEL